LLILCREEPGMITVTYMVKDIIGKFLIIIITFIFRKQTN
jgi:hypothetical protein